MNPDGFRWKNLGNAICIYVIACAGFLLIPLLDGAGSTTGTAHEAQAALGRWIYILAAVPALLALPLEIPWKKVAKYSGLIGTAFYYSRTLARLSGTALWIPVELRTMVDVLVALLGAGVFNYVYSRKKKVEASEEQELFEKATHSLKRLKKAYICNEQSEWTREEIQKIENEQTRLAVLLDKKNKYREMIAERYKRHTEKVFFRIGIVCFVGALFVFAGFMYMRARCVKGFDVRDYIANQMRDNKRATAKGFELPDRIVLSQGPTTRMVQLSSYEYHVPEFVDVERQQVYLPLCFPKPLADYISAVGQQNDTDGLTYELTNEPDNLFNAIEHNADVYKHIALTNIIFLALDAIIIALAAAGLACFFDIAAAIGEAMAG